MISSAPSTDTLFDVLSSYIDRGWPVLPIWGLRADGKTCACPDGPKCGRSKGKHPQQKLAPNGVKSATLDKAMLRGWVKANAHGHWAIRCGLPMTDGRFLVVLDEDPRNGGDLTLEQIQGHRGELPETVTEESGGGGGHYFFGSEHPVGAKKAGPGLDVLGAEKYCVITPSGHESGGTYVWAMGLGPDDVPVANAPAWLVEGSENAAPRPAREGGTARETVMGEAFALSGMLGPVFPDGVAAARCPWADEHSDNRGRGEDSSTVILPPAGGSNFGQFSCKHSHCAGRKWTDVLKALPPEHVAAAQKKYPMLRTVPAASAPPVAAKDQPQQRRDELKDIREMIHFIPCGQGSKVKPDIVNVVTILTYDPRWKDILTWDDFAQVLRIRKAPPWHKDDAPKVQGDVWCDEDITRLDAWLRRNWGAEMKTSTIREGVYVVGRRDAVNPLRDWLETLRWDGVPRLDTWLPRYLGVAAGDYSRLVGTKWMISAVARGYEPGCKADHVLILEGPQGKGKSTALKALCGAAWFSDTPIVIGSKDAYQALRGRWIIELAELASLGKSDADKLKAFFSSPTDYYRPPYGREFVDVPRSCVFAGSVNLGQYLRDETGNRRFWGVLCGAIDLQGLTEDREQLWAEAVVRYKARESWWPSYEERALFEPEARNREEVDSWTETIAQWLECETAQKILAKNGHLLTHEIVEGALKIEIGKVDRAVQFRVGAVMTRGCGWERIRVDVAKARAYAYRPSK